MIVAMICRLGEEARLPGASMPEPRVKAKTIKARPAMRRMAMITSVGRCHLSEMTLKATKRTRRLETRALSPRRARGTAMTKMTPAAIIKAVWPEGAEFCGLLMVVSKTGRGRTRLRPKATRKARAPKTPICRISRHRRRRAATRTDRTTMAPHRPMTKWELAKRRLRALARAYVRSKEFQTQSSNFCP